MPNLLWLFFFPALAYQFLAITAELLHLIRRVRTTAVRTGEPVSVLKPLRGVDPNSYAAFVSQIQQNHQQFEVLFGASDPQDQALEQVRKLQSEFPHAPIRIVTGGANTPNGKVGLLAELSRQASYPLRVVNDSDIKVTPEYLQRVTAPLSDPHIGVVTCLYRAQAHTLPTVWEALGIATDFMPSTLVAQLIGVREFGLGSTLAFRAADLEAAGGFEAIGDYLADDYQLAKRITSSGKRTLLSTYTVETSLGDASWSGVWQHQLRWARTIRFSKGGHMGLPITHAGVWATIAAAFHFWPAAACLIGLRVASALISSGCVLASKPSAALCWLAPAWDLYSFAIWLASYLGNHVRWRGRLLEIDSQGRIKAEH